MNLNHRNMKLAYGLFHNMPIFITFEQVGGGGGGGLVEAKPIDAAGKTAATTSYSGDIVNHYTYQGRKLGKKVYNSQHTLTVDEEYYDELMFSFGVPARISHGDGYVTLNKSGHAESFYFYLKDHLGNVRSVILPDANNQPVVSQANDYFPFGMSFESTLPNPGIRSNYNKLKYNSKEEQEMPGKWLDYGARFYDAQLGRWHGTDPLAEDYSSWSPYNYVMNNPLKFIDPDGMRVWPGEGLINAKNSGKVDNKTFNQMQQMEGLQSLPGHYNSLPERTQRGIEGSSKIVVGIAQAAGATAFALKSGGLGTTVAIGVFMDGAYKVGTGAHQLANAIAGTDPDQDPKFNTVAGEISQSEVVDNVVNLATGRGVQNVGAVIDGVNRISTVQSVIKTVETINESIDSHSPKRDNERD